MHPPLPQVANLYVVLTILAIHLFFKPYQKLWQNLLEAVVLIVYSLLLMIRATPTFLDTLAPYSGTEVDIVVHVHKVSCNLATFCRFQRTGMET